MFIVCNEISFNDLEVIRLCKVTSLHLNLTLHSVIHKELYVYRKPKVYPTPILGTPNIVVDRGSLF